MNDEALRQLIQQLMQPQSSGGVMTDQDASRIITHTHLEMPPLLATVL